MEQVKVTEHQITEIWQRLLLDKTELVTEDGELIRMVYPGRTNDDQGADFRDAVIATGRGLVKGDIELHVKSSDWRAHQHHRNPAYNRVILHVVMWHDTDTSTDSQNGRGVPILALNKYADIPPAWPDGAYPLTSSSMPCLDAAGHLTPAVIAECLDSAGRERFLAKAARFRADLARMEAGQALYRGIMGALGYSKNKVPFMELAHRLPLNILESLIQGKMSDEECLARQQALLLGIAGLSPTGKLEGLSAFSCHAQAMSPDAWHLFKVRPNNSPYRRIAAMSHLLLRYRRSGILKAVVDMISEAPLNRGYLTLEQGLVVTSSKTCNLALLGRERAADIIVNTLLPFAFAWGGGNSSPELQRKAFTLYGSYPRLVTNSIERHMREQLGLDGKMVNSARRQQGLIHIYNTLCTQGKCHCCSLGIQASLRLGTTSKSRLSTLPALRRK